MDYRWRWATLQVEGELGDGKRGPFVYSSSPHHRLYHPRSRVDHLAGLRVAAGRAPAACSVLSILVMWVTWWPHPCGPRGLNQIFRKPGIKYSETTEKKDSPPPFITRAKPVPPLDVGPRCPWAHRSAFAGEETANMCVKPATSNGPCAPA